MYAVVETGGKQYRVELGTELEVELVDGEPGQSITFDRVLLVADGDATAIGRPLVDGAVVDAEVVRQERGEKLVVFKYRPKARRRVKKGHRQQLTLLRVTDLRVGGKSAAEAARRAERDAKTERQRLEEAASRQAAEDAALAARLAERSKADAGTAEDTARPSRGRTSKATGTSPKPAGRARAKAADTKAADAKAADAKTGAEGAPAAGAPKRGRTRSAGPEAAKPTDEPKRRRATKKDE
ncbi:MAG TPA: 50S ribosomal protein L21 [Candidatus Limnocylindrales bacterium]|jgi:large subunit ribosomal protein L21